jgi:hypothetical protein
MALFTPDRACLRKKLGWRAAAGLDYDSALGRIVEERRTGGAMRGAGRTIALSVVGVVTVLLAARAATAATIRRRNSLPPEFP